MNSLQDAIDAVRRKVEAAQAQDAKDAGVSVEQLEAMRTERSEVENRRTALVRSEIMITRSDLELIASGGHKWTSAGNHVRAWAADEASRSILVLCGPTGVGKTFAAALAVASFGSGRCLKAFDLAVRLRPTWSELQAGADRVDPRAPFLVLDDLGAEADPTNARWQDALLKFTEHRALFGRTIITTNLQRSAFRGRYDERVCERLNSTAVFRDVAGDSLREGLGGI